MSEATSLTPWRAVEAADGNPHDGPSCHHIIDPQGHIIAHLPYDRFGEADSDLIVRAVNALPSLIEALEGLVREIQAHDAAAGISTSRLVGAFFRREQLDNARAALAAARETGGGGVKAVRVEWLEIKE